MKQLHPLAVKALDENQIIAGDRPVGFVAGQNQFKSLWTRDFSHSVRGLLRAGHIDIVGRHLDLLLHHVRTSDGLVPRILDSVSPRVRVVWNSARRLLPLPEMSFGQVLRPEYVDEHGSEAIDSNALVFLAAYDYWKARGDQKWLENNRTVLSKILNYYKSRWDGSWIVQGAFQDWQDSSRREGVTFYSNYIFHSALEKSEEMNIHLDWLDTSHYKDRIFDAFYDPSTQMFRSVKGHPELCADVPLMALSTEFFGKERLRIYQSYKKSQFWLASPMGIPGFVTDARYPRNEKTLAVRVVGLNHYHEDVYWSWLIAEGAKAAAYNQDRDEWKRIVTTLEAFFDRDQAVFEIYDSQTGRPWASLLYKAESPFTWGAAKYVEAAYQACPSD